MYVTARRFDENVCYLERRKEGVGGGERDRKRKRERGGERDGKKKRERLERKKEEAGEV